LRYKDSPFFFLTSHFRSDKLSSLLVKNLTENSELNPAQRGIQTAQFSYFFLLARQFMPSLQHAGCGKRKGYLGLLLGSARSDFAWFSR
jgi:hypothetical protein